jgi:DNA-binding response OmpR family regulator
LSQRAKVVLATGELMLQSRLTESLKQLGYDVCTVDSSRDLGDALIERPEALILDLQSSKQPLELINQARQAAVPVLAYGQHTKANILRQAREAGADLAVTRSQLVEDLPTLMESLSTASAKGH